MPAYRDRIKSLRRVRVKDLRANPKNWRTHPDSQRSAMAGVLEQVGYADAILARETSDGLEIIDGHLRAELSPESKIPVLILDVDEAEADVILATHDPLAAMATTDAGKLADLLEGMRFDSDAAMAMTESLAKAEGIAQAAEVIEDEVPEPPADPVTKSGDLWLLGDHRLLCGDSTNVEDVERLMAGAKADLCFTSPPYGQQREYTKEGKEKCEDWEGLMCGVFANLPMTEIGQVLVNLGLIHRDGEWVPYWENWIEWMREQGWRRFGWYVWDQGSGLPGDWNGRFGPSFEFVFHFNKSADRPTKWVETKEQTRALKGSKNARIGFRKEGGSAPAYSPHLMFQDFKVPDSVIRVNRHGIDGRMHPATFPTKFASYILQSWEGLVYEPFCGSGTTLIAAEQLGRKCYGLEISPAYCDVIVNRWESLTGRKGERHGKKTKANKVKTTTRRRRQTAVK